MRGNAADRKNQLKGLAVLASLLICAFGPASAQTPTLHFKCAKPNTVVVGEETAFVFSAYNAAGVKIEDAANRLVVYMTAGNGTKKYDVRFNGGEGTLKLKFDAPGFVIIQAEDKDNPDLTLSDMVNVKPVLAHRVKTEVRP